MGGRIWGILGTCTPTLASSLKLVPISKSRTLSQNLRCWWSREGCATNSPSEGWGTRAPQGQLVMAFSERRAQPGAHQGGLPPPTSRAAPHKHRRAILYSPSTSLLPPASLSFPLPLCSQSQPLLIPFSLLGNTQLRFHSTRVFCSSLEDRLPVWFLFVFFRVIQVQTVMSNRL